MGRKGNVKGRWEERESRQKLPGKGKGGQSTMAPKKKQEGGYRKTKLKTGGKKKKKTGRGTRRLVPVDARQRGRNRFGTEREHKEPSIDTGRKDENTLDESRIWETPKVLGGKG